MSDLQTMAREALAIWGGGPEPSLISHRENAVYDVRIGGVHRAALRLHRPGYRTDAQIRSELHWATALAQAGIPVPQAVPASDGEVLRWLPDGHAVSVLTWVEGTPIGSRDDFLIGNTDEMYRELGALLADLHAISDGLDLPPEFERPKWDRESFTGPNPAWGRYWQHPDLASHESGELLAARDKADQVLREVDLDSGLIHADVLRENVFRTSQGLTLIDFDDSGIGYRLYDLTTAVCQEADAPDLDRASAALLSGYRSKRTLPKTDAALLPMFLMLRAFMSLGWVMPRLAPGDPRHAVNKQRALDAARAFLDGKSVLDADG